MTVSELITKLQALPGDMPILSLSSEDDGPADIVQLSRGKWQVHGDTEDIEDGFESMIDEEPEFLLDDSGNLAVLVSW